MVNTIEDLCSLADDHDLTSELQNYLPEIVCRLESHGLLSRYGFTFNSMLVFCTETDENRSLLPKMHAMLLYAEGDIPQTVVVLQLEDVIGAVLPAPLMKCSVKQLSPWLQCRRV